MSKPSGSRVLLIASFALLCVACGGGGGGGGDVTPPGPVTGLLLSTTLSPFEVHVGWTNPADADLAGVVVAGALGAPPVFTPTNGVTYVSGTPLPGDGEIVYVGAGTTFSAPSPVGDVYVAVYAYDTSHNYSLVASAMLTIPEPPLTAQIQVSLAGVVTVTQQPPLLFLSGTGTYNGGLMTLDVDLSVRNDYGKILFNVKALVDALSEGTVTGDGLFGATPYVYYGPEGQLDGSTVMRTITVNGVTGGTDPITLDITFRHDPMLIVGNNTGGDPFLLDATGAGPDTKLELTPLSFNDPGVTAHGQGYAGTYPGCVSPDGRVLYLGNRNQPTLYVVDLATLTPAITADLSGLANIQHDGTGSLGHVSGVVMSPDASVLYASLTLNSHSYTSEGGGITGYGGPGRAGDPTEGYLVKLDRETLTEISRLQLFTGDANKSILKALVLSPDGTRLACAMKNAGLVFVVDTATMTIVDTDPMTMGTQPYDVSGHSLRPRHVAFSADGQKLYVAHAGGTDDSTLDEIDLVTHTVVPVPPPASFAGYSYNESGGLALGPDGRIWYLHSWVGGYPGLTILDTTTLVWEERNPPPNQQLPTGIVFTPDGTRYYVKERTNGINVYGVRGYDVASGAPAPFEADGSVVHTPAGANFWGHTMLITPW